MAERAAGAAFPWRDVAWRRLTAERFDLLVIGGGITGAGVARDAALRGLRVALVEAEDWASGTSSRSSRLVHGGVRYLEHGHLRLVFESSRERRTLLRIAPHLVRPLRFTWPVYLGARLPRWKLLAGLALYDALALFRNSEPHRRLSASAVLAAEPALRAEGLVGGARYADASTDDSRLTLANVLDAVARGAVALNHAAVTALGGDGPGAWAEVTDALTGRVGRVAAAVVVNASGPWSDAVRVLAGHPHPVGPTVLGSKGAHIAVPHARVGNVGAVTMIHPVDGRVLFTLPGGTVTIFGTTETPTDASPRDVRASREDVRYLLDAANHYYPRASLGEADVVSAWAGIRPLATRLVRGSAGSASREHTIEVGAHGVLHVTGGKLTTYREMATQVVDRVVAALRRAGAAAPSRRGATARVPLPGGELTSFDDTRAEAAAAAGDRGVGARLASAYGARWRDVWSLTRVRPELAESLGSGRTLAEAAHAVEREQACTLADVLVRRLRLAFELPDHGAAAAARVCDAVPALAVPDARSALDAYAADVERLLGVAGEPVAVAE